MVGNTEGSAYLLAAPSYDAELACVERGTAMGELLRRYWHPVGLSSDAGKRPTETDVQAKEGELRGAETDMQTAIDGYHGAHPTDPWKVSEGLQMAGEHLRSRKADQVKGVPIARDDQNLMSSVEPIFAYRERADRLREELADLRVRRLKHFGRVIDVVQPTQAFLDFHVPWILALGGITSAVVSWLGYAERVARLITCGS